jgi:hypothetical protein
MPDKQEISYIEYLPPEIWQKILRDVLRQTYTGVLPRILAPLAMMRRRHAFIQSLRVCRLWKVCYFCLHYDNLEYMF